MLVVGTLLAPGKRTVTAALRVMGLAHTRRFERYHRVLNRAQWSSLAASRVLLGLLVAAFVPTGPLLVGIDETIERRRGPRIAAKGIYRDPGALEPRPLRQGERLALDLPDAPGAHPLGRARLGAPLPHRAGPLGAL